MKVVAFILTAAILTLCSLVIWGQPLPLPVRRVNVVSNLPTIDSAQTGAAAVDRERPAARATHHHELCYQRRAGPAFAESGWALHESHAFVATAVTNALRVVVSTTGAITSISLKEPTLTPAWLISGLQTSTNLTDWSDCGWAANEPQRFFRTKRPAAVPANHPHQSPPQMGDSEKSLDISVSARAPNLGGRDRAARGTGIQHRQSQTAMGAHAGRRQEIDHCNWIPSAVPSMLPPKAMKNWLNAGEEGAEATGTSPPQPPQFATVCCASWAARRNISARAFLNAFRGPVGPILALLGSFQPDGVQP
jgi:hypothetical protein